MKKNTAYFISDAHLGIILPGYEEREQCLVRFLRQIGPDASELYIMGDLFDFWIEYTHAIRPHYFSVLHELMLLRENGTRIHYLAGNHDFALGPFLSRTIGVAVHHDRLEAVLQGKKTCLYHGDGVVRADRGYRILKRVLRNPFNQKLFRLLHPDIGVPLAVLFSGSSRHFLARRPTEKTLEEYREHARAVLSGGFDLVVFAHTHLAELHRYGPKVHVNPGEWIRRYTYAKMENGVVTLWRYSSDGTSEEIAPSDHAPL
jgi:UDP-2,3-diacylglucosamine hydrolase